MAKPRNVDQALKWAALNAIAKVEQRALGVELGERYVAGVKAIREAWRARERARLALSDLAETEAADDVHEFFVEPQDDLAVLERQAKRAVLREILGDEGE